MAIDKTDMARLHVEEKPYTTVINDVVQGLQNPDSLAIWVFLQSKSSGWTVVASHIQSHFGIGRQRYRAAMRCLHEEGLISYVSNRDDNGHLLGKEIVVHWRPKDCHSPNVQETERSVSPTVGETTPYEIQDIHTKQQEGTKRSRQGREPDASDIRMAELMAERVGERTETDKSGKVQSWANTMRLIRERDGRTEEQIRYLVNWTHRHEFWQMNILSPDKLRKQWDRLAMEAKQEKSKSSGRPDSRHTNLAPATANGLKETEGGGFKL